MALVRVSADFTSLSEIGSFATVDSQSRSLIVGTTSGGKFIRFEGSFDFRSEDALLKSPVTAIDFSNDAAGEDFIYAISRIRADFGDFADPDNFARLFDGNDIVQGSEGDDPLLDVILGAGNDTANGGGGNDILGASEGRDKLLGGDGDDTLVAALDPDSMTGGKGADTFALQGSGAGSKINDFSRAEGDRLFLDIDELFGGTNPTSGDPNDFVRLVGNGKKATLLIDADGDGEGFERFASIKGDIGTDLDDLITNDVILFG